MAEPLTFQELEDRLRTPDAVQANPFPVLHGIASLLSSEADEAKGRELILRALEWRADFKFGTEILEALTRSAGLYPYLSPDALDLRDSIAYEFHRPENLGDQIVFHREQAEVYRRLVAGDSVILSAPTSFGKSRIIDAMIATGKFTNIAVIVPTLALIDETRRRLSSFSGQYKIVSHLSQKPVERNIFVFTAERAVAFDKLPKVDFFVIDEFYKIGAMKADEARTVALNQAFYRLLKGGGQFYLLGPNIQTIPDGLESRFRCHFYPTRFSTVVAETVRNKGRGSSIERLISYAKQVTEPTLIYCSSPGRVNKVARALIENEAGVPTPSLASAAAWVGKHYHPEWVYGVGLTHGIGIHHGRLPRSLAQYTVRAFNEEKLRFLICTSTLIEGVNTKAKNVLILDSAIGKTPLDYFTFNNIKGRSGRMFQHFVGRVVLFNDPPQEELPFVDFPTFTQEPTTPSTLLIQMEDGDLSQQSKERVKKYSDNNALPLEVLRSNSSVDPDAQIQLARHIEQNSQTLWANLAWRGFPNRDQRNTACSLIWQFLVQSDARHGIASAAQLSFKISELSRIPDIAKRVALELDPNNKWKAKNADEAVERVLQFERNWAGFDFPRLLMTLSRVQAAVLARLQLPYGEYGQFAALVESAFRSPVVASLDEYGIPVPVAVRLEPYLRTKDDLDIAIANLKRLRLEPLNLTPFEVDLVRDAQQAM